MAEVTDRNLSAGDLLQAGIASLRARAWLAILCLVAVPGAVFAYNALNPTYEARQTVGFTPGNVIQFVFNEPRQGVAPPSAGQFMSDEVLAALSRQAGLSIDELRKRLAVEQDPDVQSEAVLVAREDSSAKADRLVAQWTDATIEFRRRVLIGAIADAREEIEERAEELRTEGTAFERRETVRRLLAVEAARAEPSDVVRVTRDPARLASFPLGASLVLGALLGLVLSLLLAWLDRRLRTPAVVESITGLPVLAHVAGPGEDRGSEEARTGIDTLKARLFLLAGRQTPSLTLVVGTSRADRAPATLALAMAADLASAGTRTLLVDGDGLLPGVADGAAADGDGDGLLAALEGRRSSTEASRPLATTGNGSGETTPRALSGSAPGLGASDPGRWLDFMERVRGEWDAVLVVFSEQRDGRALVVSQVADAWLLALTLGAARRDEVSRVVEEIEGLERQPNGVVLIETQTGAPGRVPEDHEGEAAGAERPAEGREDEPAQALRFPLPRRKTRQDEVGTTVSGDAQD